MPVYPLDYHLAVKFDREADRAWSGNHSCSLENMEMSCFASEGCNSRSSCAETFHLRDLLNNHTKVIYTDHNRQFFQGCASAHPCEDSSGLLMSFPNHAFKTGAFLVSNLCVSHQNRGHGIAKEILSHVRRQCGTVYVLVALPSKSSSAEVYSFMDTRSRNLISIYKNMGFVECDRCERSVLLCHPS